MTKFHQFITDYHLQEKINEAACLLSCLDEEPLDWILNWSKQYPVLETVLLEDLNHFETLLMEQMPMAQAPTFGDMAKNVGSAIGDYFVGPQRRFNAAIRSVDWLRRKIASIPQNDQLKTTKGEALNNWLNNIINELGAQAKQVPGLIQRYEQQKAQQAGQGQQQNSPQPQGNWPGMTQPQHQQPQAGTQAPAQSPTP